MLKGFFIYVLSLIFLVLGCNGKIDSNIAENTTGLGNSKNSAANTKFANDSTLDCPLQILPVNEASKDSLLVQQLDLLSSIVKQRDTQALFGLFHEYTIASHGGAEYGISGFKSVWYGENFWDKLQRILDLGGVFLEDGKEFIMPYCQADKFYGSWDIDWHNFGVLTTSRTLLFETSNTESPILAKLDYAIVEVMGNSAEFNAAEMIKVRPVGGNLVGYVKQSQFYCTGDCMLVFEIKDSKNWEITVFAVYD